ncbi:MAG: site-specific DNA-methyltransferase [Atopobiaceae bacterium]|nr:site-specific DNA-methyltransferase [Atopobiaceae bacterium]
MTEFEKMELESADLVSDRIEWLREQLPEVFSESGIDFDKLRLALGDEVDGGTERYAFTWPGKAAAIRQSQTPSTATLRPVPKESVNWDETENLYIEGDNLEVLKLLQRSYHGFCDFIYIDPPYNTGHDFVYRDTFGDTLANYREQTGTTRQANAESSGRYHSNWCSMLYPRLRLARELLSPDGVIAISIDDTELAQLRQICDEIFGTTNFIACLVYDKNRKNDAKYFSVGHEYMLVYFKNEALAREQGVVWRAQKEGVEEARELFASLREELGDDWNAIRERFREWYSTFEEDDPRKPLARFTKVDEKGPYRDDGNINWPGGGGPMYDVIHPVTGKPCKKPISGWRYPTLERLMEEVESGHVVFGRDHTTVPSVRTNLFEQDKQVMRSVKFSYAQTAAQQFNSLFGEKKVFDNPKPISDLEELVLYFTGDKKRATILDFFSGSATMAHAVIKANVEDGGSRRFILVQIPEVCPDNSVAKAEGFETICEIGKERIRRAGAKIAAEIEESNKQLRLGEEPKPVPDIGFRVLKLDESGIVRPKPGELLLDVVKPDRSDEDIIFEMMLKWGLELTLPIERADAAGYPCYSVACGELVCCLAPGLNMQALDAIADMEPRRVLMLDRNLDDTTKLNAVQAFKRVEEKTGREVELRTV